ncbi:MAG: peptidoglycan DD-metalloendopeptidase family protein [Chitinophagaceae bacterium]
MKKVKYYYSTKTQQFEPLQLPWWKWALRIFGILSAILVSAAIIVALAFRYLQSPNEKRMSMQLNQLQERYDVLRKDLRQAQDDLKQLEKRDNEVYRVIFEADPLPDQVRAGNIKIDEKELDKKLSPLNNEELLKQLQQSMARFYQRLKIQQRSYDTLQKFIEKKQEMLASIPSIQPVSNRQLERIASGFGVRIDPIYKILKFHAGLDFTAPTGTPVYATGDGVVEAADYQAGGYGNNIWVRHGYGYRTHYAHMVKLKSVVGQKVQRGEVIGWVGSTGKSTGPHLHYEVERNGEKIDPVHFFYNDLKAEDFDRMVKMAEAGNQSFD